MHLREMASGLGWNNVARYRVKWKALVYMVMTIWTQQEAVNCFAKWTTNVFSRTLSHRPSGWLGWWVEELANQSVR